MKKIVVIHYRVGERDGVSLEIEKRLKIIKQLGYQPYLVSGYDGLQREDSYIVEEMDLSYPECQDLLDQFFVSGTLSEEQAKERFSASQAIIEEKLRKIFDQIKPDLIFVHNILAYARNLPATAALLTVLDEYKIKTVGIHHDFWFERPKFLQPRYEFITEYLNTLPPQRDYLSHQVINSLAQNKLQEQTGIKAEKIGDYFDYSHEQPVFDDFNSSMYEDLGISPKDIVILHATRVIERKAIENAILFVEELQKEVKEKPLTLNGKTVSSDSTIHLVLPNFVEVDGLPYFKKLEKLAQEHNVSLKYVADHFMPERSSSPKKYSFWDAYLLADMVTYTSIQEGFGNQFLEAIFFKKLPLVFEYPVFLADLKPEDYSYISLGNVTEEKDGLHFVPHTKIVEAAKEALNLLANPEKVKDITEKNFAIAQQYHDEKRLKENLISLITQ